MSTKFEQLLDLLVNEEMDKANELFHEIVVEKSREIYEGLIAEEAEDEEMDESAEDEEMDESAEEEDESVDESADEEADESVDLEDSYSMEADDGFGGGEEGDDTDQLGAEIGADDEEGGDDFGGEEKSEDQAIFDIKNAIQELEAAFAELEAAQGGEMGGDEFGADDMGDEFGGEEDGEEETDEMMGQPAFEGRRMTREYVEKVGNDWDKSGSQKSQGQYAGAGSGDKDGAPVEGKSPISSGKGKPTTGATAANILGDSSTGEGTNVGTKPTGKTGGLVKNATDMKTGNGNVPGGKMGVKNLSKVSQNSKNPAPVGSGSGDKAGQTSIDPATKRQFLPQHTK